MEVSHLVGILMANFLKGIALSIGFGEWTQKRIFEFFYSLIQQFLQGNEPLTHLLNEKTLFLFWWRYKIKDTNDLVLAKASSVLKQKKNVYFCFVIHSFILARIVFVLTIPTAHRKSCAQIIFVNKIAQKNNWISRLNI